jgi:uncharacterized protein YndB with AHSA1/START domain
VTDTASVHVGAPPDKVWDVVADLDHISRWSPECHRVRWQGQPRGAVVGAKFLGFNKQGWRRWFTRNVVEEADPGRSLAWLTRDNGTRWSFRLEPDGDGTRLTQSRTLPETRPLHSKALITLFLGGVETHDQHMEENMRQTLERVKALAEGSGVGGEDVD